MSKPDEKAIGRDYCAGVLSQQAVADKYGITLKALRYMAKKNGWVRVKVPAAVKGKFGAKQGQKTGAKKQEKCPKKNAPKVAPDTDERKPESALNNMPGITQREDIDLTFDPDEFGLTEKEAYFVFYFLLTNSRVKAYGLAGFEGEGNTAYVGASRLYRKDKVSRAIRELRDRFRKKFNADVDLLVDQLMAIITADPNEIIQYRRVNCRYCWGEGHLYQYCDDDEYDRAQKKAAKDGKSPPEYGGVGFISNMDPNPDCPRCNGEGSGQIHVNDTRDLDSKAHKLYAGIKEGKFGIEVLTEDKKSARTLLAQLITKFDLNSNTDNIPRSLNDYYADIGKAKPEPSAEGVLDDTGEE